MNDKVQQIVSLLKNAPELAKMAPVIAKPLAEQALKVARAQARELGDNPLVHAAVEQLRQVPALKPAVDVAGELWTHYVGCSDCAPTDDDPLAAHHQHDVRPVEPVARPERRDDPAPSQRTKARPANDPAPPRRTKARTANESATSTAVAAPTQRQAVAPPAPVAAQTTIRPDSVPAKKPTAAPTAIPVTPTKAATAPRATATTKKASPGATARPVARAARTARGADLSELSKADLMRVAEERGIATRKSQSREQILELLTAKR